MALLVGGACGGSGVVLAAELRALAGDRAGDARVMRTAEPGSSGTKLLRLPSKRRGVAVTTLLMRAIEPGRGAVIFGVFQIGRGFEIWTFATKRWLVFGGSFRFAAPIKLVAFASRSC